jgi:hypothetical protein
MLQRDIFRAERTPVTVWVTSADRATVAPASQALANDVYADLIEKRAALLATFGTLVIPGVPPRYANVLSKSFSSLGVCVAPVIVIDPLKDTKKVAEILNSGFVSEQEVVFFAGNTKTPASPGTSTIHDVVVLHDWRRRYAREITEVVGSWGGGYRISEEDLSTAVGKCMVDCAAHELAHSMPGAANSIIIERNHDTVPVYRISELRLAGYTHETTQQNVVTELPPLGREADYYVGPAISEGIAASHSAGVVQELNREGTGRYAEYATVTYPDGSQAEVVVSHIHSDLAGRIYDKLIQKVPEVGKLAAKYNTCEISERDFIAGIQRVLPTQLAQAALAPTYSAWRECERLVDQLPDHTE